MALQWNREASQTWGHHRPRRGRETAAPAHADARRRELPLEYPDCPPATAVHRGLAMYLASQGPPVLLVPSPHGVVLGPAAASPLYRLIVDLGFRVATFDPPGRFAPPAFRGSTCLR
jgi:hypothetical protein